MSRMTIIINTIRDDCHGLVKVDDLLELLKAKDIYLSRRNLLTVYVKNTLHIHKENRKRDLLHYVSKPLLPEKYDNLYYGFSFAECVEDVYFLFVKEYKYFPSLEQFKIYFDNEEYTFLFDWKTRNNFHSITKKMTRILAECSFLERG